MSLETAFQAVNDAYLNGDTDQAQKLNTALLAQNPNYAPALFLDAQISVSFDLAAKKRLILLTKAIENDQNNQEYLVTRAETYLVADHDEIVAVGFDRDKKYLHSALADADKAIDIDVLSDYAATAYEIKAKAYVSLEKYEDAVNAWEMCRTVSERHTSTALSLIGQIKMESMQDYVGALAAYNEYVAYENNEDNIYKSDVSKAEALYYRGKLKIDYLKDKTGGVADLKAASALEQSDFYTEEYEANK